MSLNAYNQLAKNAANYVPLSPLTFLERSAFIYPERISVIHGDLQYTWKQTYERCRRLASALTQQGVSRGDTVATMLPNTPAMYEAHFGVPMTGAVLNTLNTRLDAEAIAFMLRHGQAKVLLTDREFATVVGQSLALLAPEERPYVIDVHDEQFGEGQDHGEIEYEAFLAKGDPEFQWGMPEDEWEAIALNYLVETPESWQITEHGKLFLNSLLELFLAE